MSIIPYYIIPTVIHSNMKRRDRSSSSLRAKTVQSEMDFSTDNNYWIGSMDESSSEHRQAHKVASSMLVEVNKQNVGMNTPPIYKSVSGNLNQRQATKQFQSRQWAEMPKGKVQLIQELQVSENDNQFGKDGKQKVSEGQQCSCKSSRHEKEQNEKNLLIKEINSNSIEIKRLREEMVLYKSEKQTLKLIMKEREARIEELQEEIGQVEKQRKKIENYQYQFRETQATIKEIEAQTERIREDNRAKDAKIVSSSQKICTLEEKLAAYEQEVKQFQKAVLSLKESSSTTSKTIIEIEEECNEWKEKYFTVKKQLETIPELEIKLKSSLSTTQDLRSRIKELINTNQKLKIDLGNHQTLKKKITEYEEENSSIKKRLQDKLEELKRITNSTFETEGLKDEVARLSEKSKGLEKKNLECEQELRKNIHKLEEKDVKITNLYEELEDVIKENSRMKERHEKIDTLYNENKNLRESLFEKIGEIEELQRRINVMESKNVLLTNESRKLQVMLDSTNEQLHVMESNFQNMKNRWETEMGAKLGLQEKCNRFTKQLSSLRNQITCLENHHKSLIDNYEQKILEFKEQKQGFYQQLSEVLEYKEQAETNLSQQKQRIQNLTDELRELRNLFASSSEREQNNLHSIKRLEVKLFELTEDLEKYKDRENKNKELWKVISQCSNKALTHQTTTTK